MRDISAWHLALILLAFVLLFGYKKLPDATRSLGRSLRILKSEVRGMHDDEPKTAEPTTPDTRSAEARPAEPKAVESRPADSTPVDSRPRESADTAGQSSERPAAGEPVRTAAEPRIDTDRT